jgi:hypothetical protein
MQNWHLGPLGLQIMVDQAMMAYILGLEKALVLRLSDDLVPIPPSIDSIMMPDYKNCHSNDDITKNLAFHKYFCRKGGIVNTKYYAACGLGPQFVTGSNLDSDVAVPGKRAGVFPQITGPSVGSFTWFQIKPPSGVHTAAEQVISNYRSRSECTNHPDMGFTYNLIPEGKVRSSEWLELRVNAHAVKALEGVRKVHLYLCSGLRDNGYSPGFENVWVLFAINNKIFGSGFRGNSFCIRANQPNAFDTPSEGAVLGVRFTANESISNIHLPAVHVSGIFLIAADESETPVPSTLAEFPKLPEETASNAPTPSITSSPSLDEAGKATEVPHPSDTEILDGSTEVPHPSDSTEDTPTEVPHPSDDNGVTEVPHPSDGDD